MLSTITCAGSSYLVQLCAHPTLIVVVKHDYLIIQIAQIWVHVVFQCLDTLTAIIPYASSATDLTYIYRVRVGVGIDPVKRA